MYVYIYIYIVVCCGNFGLHKYIVVLITNVNAALSRISLFGKIEMTFFYYCFTYLFNLNG